MDLSQYNAVVGSTAAEFADTGLDLSQLFAWQIARQNAMYELPINEAPTLDALGETPTSRMQGFLRTLQKEMAEGAEILAFMQVLEKRVMHGIDWDANLIAQSLVDNGVPASRIESLVDAFTLAIDTRKEGITVDEEFERQILVMVADWLGDMQVYNRSEALKYGIPLEAILMCIMGSNFTKLGADGEVLKDENGKVLKGPHFIAPEKHIYATMFEQEELLEDFAMRQQELENFATLAIPALNNPTSEAIDALNEYDDEDEEDQQLFQLESDELTEDDDELPLQDENSDEGKSTGE